MMRCGSEASWGYPKTHTVPEEQNVVPKQTMARLAFLVGRGLCSPAWLRVKQVTATARQPIIAEHLRRSMPPRASSAHAGEVINAATTL